MPNIVYVLTNPAMPGIVKIGLTDRPGVQQRMKELYSTGVPLPFECVIAKRIEDREAADIENALHTAFGPYRMNDSREFFSIDPEQAEILLQVMPGENVTPRASEQEAELTPEDRDAITRWSQTGEQEFLESLDENGIRVFERVLPLGKRERMRIIWGTKGFSLNAVSNGAMIAVCRGYPPNCKFRQTVRTDFGYSISEKSNIPEGVIDDLKAAARDTGLFSSVGSKDELVCRIDRRLDESELTNLTGWLESVVSRIREFEAVNSDEGEQVTEATAETASRP